VVTLAVQLSDGRSAKLNLIDLAGSEDNRLTGNTGARLLESGSINSSLFVLGRVIDALNEKSKGLGSSVHVPYRESKLTRLLQDSLGGGSAAVMVCCVAPEPSEATSTLATVSYGSKARSIVNHLQATLAARSFAAATPAATLPPNTPSASAPQGASGGELDKLLSRLETWKRSRTPKPAPKAPRPSLPLATHGKSLHLSTSAAAYRLASLLRVPTPPHTARAPPPAPIAALPATPPAPLAAVAPPATPAALGREAGAAARADPASSPTRARAAALGHAALQQERSGNWEAAARTLTAALSELPLGHASATPARSKIAQLETKVRALFDRYFVV
jgi:hypothetical protein